MFLKISQYSLENTYARFSFIIMLRAVVSALCQEYIKDKILTHVPAFLSSNSFFFLFPLAAFWSSSWKFYIVFTLWCWYQKDVQNPAKYLRSSFLRKQLTAWNRYFGKKLHLRYLTGFWILLWMVGCYSRGFSEKLVMLNL